VLARNNSILVSGSVSGELPTLTANSPVGVLLGVLYDMAVRPLNFKTFIVSDISDVFPAPSKPSQTTVKVISTVWSSAQLIIRVGSAVQDKYHLRGYNDGWKWLPLTLKVRDVMDTKVVEVDGRQPVSDVIKAMLDNNVWSVVVTVDGLPSGVITERDIIRRVIAKGLSLSVKAREIMTSPIITVSPDVSLGEAMAKMVEKNIRRLFVVEKGKLIGRITQTELFENNLNVMMTLSSIKYQL
jgi:CBS domain-containing protein